MDWNYIAIERDFLIDLVTEVNRRMGEGYIPLGGVGMTRSGGYIQAMIREIKG